MVIVIFGLVGSGKSTVAQALSEKLNGEVFNSDVVRKEMAGLKPFESAKSDFTQGIYTQEFTDKVYEELAKRAIETVKKGKIAILDATFKSKNYRTLLRKLCSEKNIPVKFFYLDVPEEEIKKRLEKREKEKTVSDADFNIYLKMKNSFDPIENDVIMIDGTATPERVAEIILKKLKEAKDVQ
ncbi:conserved hypothetical protein [Thermosulfidibacter takaii ABI70S6]|uniref:gluconokinase n=1 Tax=Thermosulfidibacter takaii (strain DSM 17441 / JCM 13301 / NBRC 103674 / ABI70S6) TaxID=1298851 RepID=A0A0S3QRC8_THET7|nr:AAA family ATPase [Thermosulfidibacter takaii]BAT70833.1 conserved hypothetical protein [Thermosulfidibacter takaii ABI70S6]